MAKHVKDKGGKLPLTRWAKWSLVKLAILFVILAFAFAAPYLTEGMDTPAERLISAIAIVAVFAGLFALSQYVDRRYGA